VGGNNTVNSCNFSRRIACGTSRADAMLDQRQCYPERRAVQSDGPSAPAAGEPPGAAVRGRLLRPRGGTHRGNRQEHHRERIPVVPNVNVTYADMQSAATRLNAGEHQINGDLTNLQNMINQLVQGGYVTDTSSKQFEQSYTEFTQGARKMMDGLNGMAQYLNAAAKAFHETDTQLAAALKK
jgi:WXG100 family type VII secretion target